MTPWSSDMAAQVWWPPTCPPHSLASPWSRAEPGLPSWLHGLKGPCCWDLGRNAESRTPLRPLGVDILGLGLGTWWPLGSIDRKQLLQGKGLASRRSCATLTPRLGAAWACGQAAFASCPGTLPHGQERPRGLDPGLRGTGPPALAFPPARLPPAPLPHYPSARLNQAPGTSTAPR